MILKCRCNHPYQDQLYGPYWRVHTPTRKSDGKMARCTVCGNEQLTGSTPGQSKKEQAKKQKAKGKVKDQEQEKAKGRT